MNIWTAKLLECGTGTVFPILAHFLPHNMWSENMCVRHLKLFWSSNLREKLFFRCYILQNTMILIFHLYQRKILHSCHIKELQNCCCLCDLRRKTNNLDIKGWINLIFSVCLLQSLHVEAWSCRVNRAGSSFTECIANIYFSQKKYCSEGV